MHMIPVYTAGSHLNPRHFYCHFDVVCFLTSTSHTHPIFLANTRTLTQSRSLSSKPSTPTPPFPREGVRMREVECFFEANTFHHALDRAFFWAMSLFPVRASLDDCTCAFCEFYLLLKLFFFSGNISVCDVTETCVGRLFPVELTNTVRCELPNSLPSYMTNIFTSTVGLKWFTPVHIKPNRNIVE